LKVETSQYTVEEGNLLIYGNATSLLMLFKSVATV